MTREVVCALCAAIAGDVERAGLTRDERETVYRGLCSDVRRSALATRRGATGTQRDDSYLGAGAVYVMPDGPAAAGEPMRRLACGCVPRFTLVEACAQVAALLEREALGSPIAQDTARRIRLAILALR